MDVNGLTFDSRSRGLARETLMYETVPNIPMAVICVSPYLTWVYGWFQKNMAITKSVTSRVRNDMIVFRKQ